jgi:DNA polymerase III delta prime subunit
MVGQTNLIDRFKSYSVSNFPNTALITGDKGSGKRTIISKIISTHLGLEVIDITSNISFDLITEIQLKAIPYIYLIQADFISEKEQNMLLKFIEEPPLNSKIIITSEQKDNLLSTIVNRCVVFQMEPYTEKELLSFISYKEDAVKRLSLEIFKTPGQIVSTQEETLKSMNLLTQKIILKSKESNYASILNVSDKINYKDEEGKYDIDVFFNLLVYNSYNEYKINSKENVLKLYNKIVETKNKLKTPRISKQALFENFLTTLWKMEKEYNETRQ